MSQTISVYCIQCIMRVMLGTEMNSRGGVVGTSDRKLSSQINMQVFHYHQSPEKSHIHIEMCTTSTGKYR